MLEGSLARVSNRADWIETVELTDGETGDLIDLSGGTLVFEVASGDNTLLSATTDNGKAVIVSMGVAQFSFTKAEMQGIRPGVYQVGGTFTRDGRTDPFFIGTVPVINGVVR